VKLNYCSYTNASFLKAENDVDTTFTYGKRNRPGTPIKDVLGGTYCEMGAFMQKSRQNYYKKVGAPVKLPADKPTKASQLANSFVNTRVTEQKENKEKKLFKLSKFEKVKPRTETHAGKRVKSAIRN